MKFLIPFILIAGLNAQAAEKHLVCSSAKEGVPPQRQEMRFSAFFTVNEFIDADGKTALNLHPSEMGQISYMKFGSFFSGDGSLICQSSPPLKDNMTINCVGYWGDFGNQDTLVNGKLTYRADSSSSLSLRSSNYNSDLICKLE